MGRPLMRSWGVRSQFRAEYAKQKLSHAQSSRRWQSWVALKALPSESRRVSRGKEETEGDSGGLGAREEGAMTTGDDGDGIQSHLPTGASRVFFPSLAAVI